jgi:hypothetical protein
MRSYAVFVVIVVLLGTLGVMLARRDRTPYAAPLGPPSSADGGAVDAEAAPVAAAPPDSGPAAKMDRALKVTALGWDVLAAGVVENGGSTAGPLSGFTAHGLDVQLTVSDGVEKLEERLASGGAAAEGADVAILPLPVYVAAYEQVRALEPEVVLVVGWSRGREGLNGRAASLVPPPTGDDVRLVSNGADASTMLGLFMLDLSGVPLSHVRLVKASSDDAHSAAFAAVDRSHAGASLDGRHLLLTTADASRLVPIVAVAPHGLVQGHGLALSAWAEGWVHGLEQLRKDVPDAARRVAAIEGAPEAVVLLMALGQLEPATLRDNAELMGLSGRGAATLERLFQSEWQLWRGAGVLSTPAPDHAPLATGVVTSLVRSDPSLAEASAPEAPAAATGPAKPQKSGVLVLHPETGRSDEGRLVGDVGWIAGIFDRSTVRVTATSRPVVSRASASAREQFELPAARVIEGKGAPPAGAWAAVEVVAAP